MLRFSKRDALIAWLDGLCTTANTQFCEKPLVVPLTSLNWKLYQAVNPMRF